MNLARKAFGSEGDCCRCYEQAFARITSERFTRHYYYYHCLSVSLLLFIIVIFMIGRGPFSAPAKRVLSPMGTKSFSRQQS